VECNAKAVVKALFKRNGAKTQTLVHLLVKLVIVMVTAMNVSIRRRLMPRGNLWISMETMKAVVFVKIAEITLKVNRWFEL
jgi:lipoate-protein ligase B